MKNRIVSFYRKKQPLGVKPPLVCSMKEQAGLSEPVSIKICSLVFRHLVLRVLEGSRELGQYNTSITDSEGRLSFYQGRVLQLPTQKA